MKKIIALFAALAAMTTALTACSGDENNDNNTTTAPPVISDNTDNTSDNAENTEDTAENTENTENTEDTDTEDGGNENDPSADSETGKILAAIRDAYGENFLPDMEFPQEMIADTYGIREDTYDEITVQVPMISAHPDTVIIVKAAAGKGDDVKAALEAHRTYLIEESMQYPMNIAKVNATKVVENGDFYALLLLGRPDEREDASDAEMAEYAEQQVQIGVDAFNGYFA